MGKKIRKEEKGGKKEKENQFVELYKNCLLEKNVVTLNKTTEKIYVINKNFWN